MKYILTLLLLINGILLVAQENIPSKWYLYETKNFDLYFTQSDSSEVSKYLAYFDNAYQSIEDYFGQKFLTKFEVYIHPNRNSLDLEWSANWDMPGFKSQCWMVGSGVADQFDLLSPKAWAKEACEHDSNNELEIQQLVTHEMMHVFHGQINLDHFFSGMQEMAWFIEGISVLVSGQLNEKRLSDVKPIVLEDRYPRDITKFWEGDLRYGLSGSLVAYIQSQFGTEKLVQLLKTQSNEELLNNIEMTEESLIENWVDSFLNRKFSP